MSSAEVLATVDIAVFRLGTDGLELLLGLRRREPYEGKWALPGVIINGRCADESLEAAAARTLQEKARIAPAYLEQVCTVGNGVRDPRGWSLSTLYLALVPPSTAAGDDLRFVPAEQAAQGHVALPFDHNLLVAQALQRLASKALYTSLPLHLLERTFTVLDGLGAFAACIGQPLQQTTLRRRLERMKQDGWVRDTGELNKPPMGRPQALYEHSPRRGELFLFERSVLA